MASAKDRAEALAYLRRRLVQAFLLGPSGASGQPPRPAALVWASSALAVLLVGGAGAWGAVTDRPTPVDWDATGLVVSAETGQVYVVPGDGGRPWPASNATSARLAVGDPTLRPVPVPDAEIRDRDPGVERGIPGAPPVPADAGRLDGRRWQACQGIDRLRTQVGGGVDLPHRPVAFVVTTGPAGFHLLADGGDGAFAHRLPAGGPAADGVRDDLLTRLGLPVGALAVPVESAFLRLFPTGGPVSLQALGVDAEHPGELVTDGERTWLETDGGTVLLDDFSLAVHRALTGRSPRRGHPVGAWDPPPWAAAHWPSGIGEAGTGAPCAALDASGPEPVVRLLAARGGRTSEPAGPVVGDGAWVRRWRDGPTGAPVLVGPAGTTHAVPDEEDARALGLEKATPVAVPDPWLDLLEAGAALTRERAVRPATTRAGP